LVRFATSTSTNQFNPTTRRYSGEEIAALADDGRSLMLQFRLTDRFGDNGLVSVMILRPDADDDDVLDIDTWVMSCRVFGRQLEVEAMNIAVETARARGIRAFRSEYIPTERNKVVSDLYPQLGFVRSDGPPEGDTTRWRLDLTEYVPTPTHIARIAAD
jgi:FkbH-like protein